MPKLARGGASRSLCTTHASGQPLLYKASRLFTASVLHLGMQLFNFYLFLYFLTLLPLSCIRGLSTNFLDGGASVKGHPKMLPVTASRHPDSEMMVVPGFPASHHHRLSLFLSLSLCINNIEKYPSRLCCGATGI